MQRITPCLWFDGKAEEAARFYTSVFKKSKMGAITRYGETGPGKKGSVMTVTFEIEGQEVMGLNGGPRMMKDKDPAKTERVMAAVMKMVKLDIKALKKVYKG